MCFGAVQRESAEFMLIEIGFAIDQLFQIISKDFRLCWKQKPDESQFKRITQLVERLYLPENQK